MSFFEKEYQVPKSDSAYMKFKQGDNIFRILANVVMGWEDWKQDGDKKVPVRTKYEGESSKPKPLGKNAVKHFWAFPVWDYTDKKIKVLEITQGGIQNSIYNSHLDEDFGDPKGYDLKVTRNGEGIETSYETLAKPPKELAPEIKEAWENTYVDCNALFTNDDPFEKKEGVVKKDKEAKTDEPKEETNIDDIDFGTPDFN